MGLLGIYKNFKFFRNVQDCLSFFFIRYFLHLHFTCYPKVPYTLPCPAPQPTHSYFLALAFPCTGAYNLCKTKGLSSQRWPTRPYSATYAARDTSSGRYWLVHIVVPSIELQTPLAPWVISLAPPEAKVGLLSVAVSRLVCVCVCVCARARVCMCV